MTTDERWHSDPLICKARELLLRAHKLAGTPEAEILGPSPGDSTRVGDLIVLRFGDQVVARFKVRTPGSRLRRLVAPVAGRQAEQPAASTHGDDR